MNIIYANKLNVIYLIKIWFTGCLHAMSFPLSTSTSTIIFYNTFHKNGTNTNKSALWHSQTGYYINKYM